MTREDAEIIIRFVFDTLQAAGVSSGATNATVVSEATRRFIQSAIMSGQPHPADAAADLRPYATNMPLDVWDLQRRYAGRDMNGILYELEELKAKYEALTRCQYGQSPVDIDAERFRWILRNLGDREAMAAVMENPMRLAEQGSLAVAGAELKTLIDGVRFQS